MHFPEEIKMNLGMLTSEMCKALRKTNKHDDDKQSHFAFSRRDLPTHDSLNEYSVIKFKVENECVIAVEWVENFHVSENWAVEYFIAGETASKDDE